MFAFRRFVAPLALCPKVMQCSPLMTSTAAILAAPVLSSAACLSSTDNSDRYARRGSSSSTSSSSGNYSRSSNNNDGNNYNRGGNRGRSNDAGEPRDYSNFRRASEVIPYSEPFVDILSPADTVASGKGFRLLLSYPSSDASFMDVLYSPQLRDREAAVPDASRARLFGQAHVALSLRMYPLQMAKVVAVLEGRASEAVVASRMAVGTFKTNSDGTFTYAIQSRVARPEEKSLQSAEVTLTALHGFMLQKFLNRVLVAGFNPNRDVVPTVNRGM